MGAYNLVCHPGISIEVSEFHTAQKANFVFGQDVGVNYAGMFQNLLQKLDTADGLPLYAASLTVTSIIAPVPLGTHLRKIFRHFGVNLVDKVVQLGRNLVVPLF